MRLGVEIYDSVALGKPSKNNDAASFQQFALADKGYVSKVLT